ncbi:cytochrome b [Gallaecimonas xiamenensis]|uniref:Cytochrome b/b6 domain n=1 Tax=Gallaecimonas xiamenensis 3-C-1 TaxID=745411 RepID=K2JLM5_9GAMM|nr:cytochrome b/b6 domain-containing protein [Gallaecimonas xiamenensis]EKE71439.1 Cytochrome b/b6 domain [Gallaecimonas xiamenensis 3-C-1]
MLRNTPSQYGLVARLLHHLMALLVLGLFLLGLVMDLPEKGGALASALKALHLNLGTLAMLLLILRSLWRASNPIPEAGLSAPNARWAHIGHLALYGAMALQMLLGLLILLSRSRDTPLWWGLTLPGAGWSWLHKAAEEAHQWLAWGLMALVAGHLVMVLVHKAKGDSSQRGMLKRD